MEKTMKLISKLRGYDLIKFVLLHYLRWINSNKNKWIDEYINEWIYKWSMAWLIAQSVLIDGGIGELIDWLIDSIEWLID